MIYDSKKTKVIIDPSLNHLLTMEVRSNYPGGKTFVHIGRQEKRR